MKKWIKNYMKISSLVSSVLFLILGAIMYTKPETIVLVVSYIFGGILIVVGLTNCIKNYMQLKNDNKTSSADMIIGVLMITFGLIFVLMAQVIEAVIRLIIGGWILFIGINRLIVSLRLKSNKTINIINLLLSILMISAGLYTILKTNLAFQALGLVMIIYSSIEIVNYIVNINDINKPKENIDQKVIEAEVLNK